jgi:aminoglycoside 3-N-acetyltransferase I
MAVKVQRLGPADADEARRLFPLMAGVFGEAYEPGSRRRVASLLARRDFFAIAAWVGDRLAGGVTAHALPMTRSSESELFIYDVAVMPPYQRRGVGRALLKALRQAAAAAGIAEMFVAAENEDRDAIAFYRALGGAPSKTTFFVFRTR